LLTTQQAREIVRDCILEVTRVARKVNAQQRLKIFGIDSGTKLKRFKSMIIKHVGRRKHEIAATDLNFNQNVLIATIYDLIVGKATPLMEKRRPGGYKKEKKRKAAKARPRSSGVSRKALKDYFLIDAESERSMVTHELIGSEATGDNISGDDEKGAERPSDEDGFNPPSPPSRPKTEQPHQLPNRVIQCTPQVEFRKELLPKKVYNMAVFVDQGSAALGAEVQPVKIVLSQEIQEFELDVWLDCSSHFSVEEVRDPSRITVKTETGVSDELGFTLTVLKAPDNRPMYLSAFFRYNERPCGKITRYLELARAGLIWKQFDASGKPEGEAVLPKADASPSVAVEIQAKPAEIRTEVLRTEANDGQHYTLKCHTSQDEWAGAWNLPQVTKDLVNVYMQKVMANEGDARIASLEGAGMAFWDAIPAQVKALLWDALEKGAKTMSVISEEPYIPWELMVPYKKIQNPRRPLGIELRLGRWITGDYKAARQFVPMKNGYIVCPKTSGLTSSAQEVTFLTQQLRPDFAPVEEVVPASFTGVNKGLAGPSRHVIHFICHGKSAALQTLELDKPDTLDCSQVRTLKGFQAAFKDGPLAFLNACEVGGQVLALDGVGGFANSFIELGASAVVAPLWPVQDKVALDVTRTFYSQALKGVAFAEIMQEIRAKAYDEGIDSYAAYCFYGDPMASTTPT